MARGADSARLARLDELAALLRGGDQTTIAELAERLGVSRRTLTRDIDLLRERGLPIDASIGRGGGVRLHRHWSVGRAVLDYREAVSLLISLALAERLGSPMMLDALASARNKLALTFSDPERERIRMLRRRILVSGQSSDAVRAGLGDVPLAGLAPVQEAFFEMKAMRIAYVDQQGARTERTIEPHYLLLAWPAWYLLAWDGLRDDVRTFRLDRVVHAEATGERFRLRPERVFEPVIAGIGEPI